ncbi:response regulator transcription factor [Neoroseomonas lacus]|uniref:Response regulator n=1 Tax=Neoroseomonas lacus TaxID=287609 RepID=A0A917K9F5_9PROT|nr:response regulator [Neoroseomonas lacus]GGJ04730.1 response regulator [Neoroseomonas lacus]
MHPVPLIAVVDDDEAVRGSLSSLLRSLGYGVRCYGSADAFLRTEEPRPPACLILDVQMPGMTGPELQVSLAASGRSIPIIFMTGFPTEAVRQQVMQAGARAYLNKPVDGDTIAQCLAHALADACVAGPSRVDPAASSM